jgi:(R,R)-butanediol dehydrogenase / meso-butanediol dehydrogenase / diacetyl reductase
MSAARYLAVAGPRELHAGGATVTDASSGHVIVDITYTGICGTDVHGYTDGHMLPPAVFGHEWTGTIASIGDGVDGLRVGQRVVGGVGPACGHCAQCVAGHTRNCDTVFAEANGVDRDAPPYGAFATSVHVSSRRVIPVPDRLSDVEAALVEPTTVTYHAVRRVAAELGATTVVQGAGPIGLLTAENARSAGAGPLIISEPTPARRALATHLGFTHVVEPADLRSALDDLARGLGADVVYECTGVPSLFQSTAELVRRGGTLALLGYPLENSSVSYGDWQSRELTVMGSLAYNHEDFVGAMHAIAAGHLDVAPLHTGTFGLPSLKGILEELDSGSSEHTKVLISPMEH